MKKLLKVSLALILGGVILAGQVLARDFPQPAGYVNDFAQVLSEDTKATLENDLTAFEAASGYEIAVVTLKSLEGDTVENVAVALFEQWGIGKKGQDNGVLLLIAVDDRQLKIEVGYGAEAILTDSRAGNIIRSEITPQFKVGDYDAGVIAAVTAIIEVLSQDPGAFDEPAEAGASTFNFFPSRRNFHRPLGFAFRLYLVQKLPHSTKKGSGQFLVVFPRRFFFRWFFRGFFRRFWRRLFWWWRSLR